MNSEFALSQKNIYNLLFDKYQRDFTFIVNNKQYSTSRIVADLLSPIIAQNHFNDSSNEEFVIKIDPETKDDYFKEFLELTKFNKIILDEKQRTLYSEYFLQLGNIAEYISLSNLDLQSNEMNENQSIEILEKVTKFENYNNDVYNEFIQNHIENICKNFSSIDKERLKNLKLTFLDAIFKNDYLKLDEEDELLDFLIKLYEINPMCSELFEYVHFLNVSENKMKEFIDAFSIEDLNSHVWKSICSRLVPTFNQNKENENRYTKQKVKPNSNVKIFEYTEGKEFEGIMNFLTNETGGNIHDNGTIEIKSNSIGQGNPKYVVDYKNNDTYYDPNSNYKGAYVCFDFKDKLVQLTSYSIKSFSCRFLKNWSIEVSNDGQNWMEIDRHKNDSKLKGESKISTFKISPEQNEFYRFIRLLETGCQWDGDSRYDGDFSMIEFFGQLQKPLLQ